MIKLIKTELIKLFYSWSVWVFFGISVFLFIEGAFDFEKYINTIDKTLCLASIFQFLLALVIIKTLIQHIIPTPKLEAYKIHGFTVHMLGVKKWGTIQKKEFLLPIVSLVIFIIVIVLCVIVEKNVGNITILKKLEFAFTYSIIMFSYLIFAYIFVSRITKTNAINYILLCSSIIITNFISYIIYVIFKAFFLKNIIHNFLILNLSIFVFIISVVLITILDYILLSKLIAKFKSQK